MPETNIKILFICKKRNDFYGPSFGLINSCRFIANALMKDGIQCKIVSVIDNNSIDKEVHDYNPTHVFIEALWVVPPKFEQLIPLHPKVQWFVRVHSKIPFISHEGIAMEWLRAYYAISKVYPQFHIAANSEEVVEAFDVCYDIPVEYFPNIYCPFDYDTQFEEEEKTGSKKIVNIGCFGAIRPMKNHLNQALAAIAFGNEKGLKIYFNVNSDRCDDGGDPVLRNLNYAFKDTPHKLILNPWLDHKDFIGLVRMMDLGMQVSMSESFNIVAADFVWNDVAIVGSDEIGWLDRRYKADPNSVENMVDKLRFAYAGRRYNTQKVNLENLEKYNKKSTKVWLDALE